MEDKIDVHGTEARYDALIDKLMTDESLNTRNKELILKFVCDCKLGRTIKGRAKKKIGKKRIIKYVYMLRTLSNYLGMPFDQANQTELEKLVSDIEEKTFRASL